MMWKRLVLFVSALLAMGGCALTPDGQTTSLVGVGVESGASGVWTDGGTVVARGDEVRLRIWSKAPQLWAVPIEWAVFAEEALLEGKIVCIRIYPAEYVEATSIEEVPVWALWALEERPQ